MGTVTNVMNGFNAKLVLGRCSLLIPHRNIRKQNVFSFPHGDKKGKMIGNELLKPFDNFLNSSSILTDLTRPRSISWMTLFTVEL